MDKAKQLCGFYDLTLIDKGELYGFCANNETGNTNDFFDVSEVINRKKFEDYFGIDEDGYYGDIDLDFRLPEFLTEVSQILEPGYVFIWMSCGHEKVRYLSGAAQAINSEGTIVTITLDDIYEQVKELGKFCTRATY